MTSFSQGAMPTTYVVDNAGIIDQNVRNLLSLRLHELEQKTGAQMIVLTVQTTDSIPIEEYAFKRAEAWKLGQKGKDNGLIFVVAVQDRKYRIEVGYGLESVIPDSLAGTIGRKVIVPHFKEGEYSEGIRVASVTIMDLIARSQGVSLSSSPLPAEKQHQTARRGAGLGNAALLFIILIVLSLIQKFSRRGRSFWHRGSYGGFGTFGGGGFGGGGFGGGGASGGW